MAQEDGGRRRTNGRSARVRHAVIDATLEQLAEGRFDQFTVAVAASRSGVHETSIYRRWGTCEKLMLDAVLSASETRLRDPDLGSLRKDLAAMAAELCRYLATPLGLAVARLLTSPTSDLAAEEMRAEIWRERMGAAASVVQRAVDRGEVSASTDPRLIIEMMVAPIHLRVIMREPLEPDLPARLADTIYQGIRAL